MAHTIRINALTDELITILTSVSTNTDPNRFNTYRESALRTLRFNNYPRTDQFAVQHSLEGLEEKFRVYNKDDLADELRQRLDELSIHSAKWSPEILHLLLELSDRPILNTKLENLKRLRQFEEIVEPVLKWEDLVVEDPLLRDKNVWRNIDYGVESSDDDDGNSLASINDLSSLTENSSQFSVDGNDSGLPTGCTVPIDCTGLHTLQSAQFWRHTSLENRTNLKDDFGDKILVTELQAVRETICMLAGYSTSLFIINSTPAHQIKAEPQYLLSHMSYSAFHEILSHFAQQGTVILRLREWVQTTQPTPLLQSLQQEIEKCLHSFNIYLLKIEHRLVAPNKSVVVRLVDLQTELFSSIERIAKLSILIQGLSKDPYANEFLCLELLYEETCKSQLNGDTHMFCFVGGIFFGCLQIYLRPIRDWMENGELTKGDGAFFISQRDAEVELGRQWLDRYILRYTSSGTLQAPKFLHVTANKIFTTGKSVVVLKRLGKYPSNGTRNGGYEPKLDFETVAKSAISSIIPFAELFDVAFDEWVRSKHLAASSTLCGCLLNECGLLGSLRAFHRIYLMADGSAVDTFARGIFEKLDNEKKHWNDPFFLTELAQTTIGELTSVSRERLKVLFDTSKSLSVSRTRKSVKVLSTIHVTYRLPWPVQIVLTSDTITYYHQVFRFLLQIRRATYMAENDRILQDTASMNSSADERALHYGLRQRLLWFSTSLYNYVTDLVIQESTMEMAEALARAEDVDQMICRHQEYCERLRDQSLLGTRLEPIHNSIINILDLSLSLYEARTRNMSSQDQENTSTSIRTKHSRNSRRRPHGDLDSSDEEESDLGNHRGDCDTNDNEEPYIDKLRHIREQFDHLCRFVITGLRSVARAGGDPKWGFLAERLESGFQKMTV